MISLHHNDTNADSGSQGQVKTIKTVVFASLANKTHFITCVWCIVFETLLQLRLLLLLSARLAFHPSAK